MSIRTWVMATRPKTLTAAIVPIGVGTALAFAIHGKIQPFMSLFAFFSSVFIQIGTNFINDAMDFKKGADTQDRLGPQRVTQSGLLSPQQVWWGGIFCFLIAALLALPLVYEGGWPILLIGVFSLLAGYAYTGGPYPLAYVGLGDIFVLIFFGWVAVSGIYYLNTGSFDGSAGVAGLQIGLLATVLIAINNFRDYLTDRVASKRTLVVRFGPGFARTEVALLCLVPFFVGIYWFQQGLVWAAFLPLFMFPFAVRIVRKVSQTEPGVIFNSFLAQSAILHLGFGLLLTVGLCLR